MLDLNFDLPGQTPFSVVDNELQVQLEPHLGLRLRTSYS
jgi:hypothetical protein